VACPCSAIRFLLHEFDAAAGNRADVFLRIPDLRARGGLSLPSAASSPPTPICPSDCGMIWPLTPIVARLSGGGDERWYSDFQPYRPAPDPRAAGTHARFPINP
jgi:hypothetical protein